MKKVHNGTFKCLTALHPIEIILDFSVGVILNPSRSITHFTPCSVHVNIAIMKVFRGLVNSEQKSVFKEKAGGPVWKVLIRADRVPHCAAIHFISQKALSTLIPATPPLHSLHLFTDLFLTFFIQSVKFNAPSSVSSISYPGSDGCTSSRCPGHVSWCAPQGALGKAGAPRSRTRPCTQSGSSIALFFGLGNRMYR